MSKADIELLFDVAGGGSISGASGKKIKDSLDSIVNEINRTPYTIDISLNPSSIQSFRDELAGLTAYAQSEARRLQDAYSGIQFPTPPGSPGNTGSHPRGAPPSGGNGGNGAPPAGGNGGHGNPPVGQYEEAARAVREYYDALIELGKNRSARDDIRQNDTGYYLSESGHYEELANTLNRTRTAYDLVVNARSQMNNAHQARLQTLMTTQQLRYNKAIEDQANKERLAANAARDRLDNREAIRAEREEYSQGMSVINEYYAAQLKFNKAESDVFVNDDGFFRSRSGNYENLANLLNRTSAAYNELQRSMVFMSENNYYRLLAHNHEAYNDYNLALEEHANKQRIAAEAASDSVTRQSAEMKELRVHISSVDSAYRQLLSGNLRADMPEEEVSAVREKYIEFSQEIERMNAVGATGTNEHIEKVRLLQDELKRLLGISRVQVTPVDTENNLIKVNNLIAEITKNHKEWTAAANGTSSSYYNALPEYIKGLAELKSSLVAGSISQEEFDKQFDSIAAHAAAANKQIKAAGENTQRWYDRMGGLAKKFVSWFSVSEFIMTAWNTMQKMLDCIIDVDTAMTELKKVTDETDAVYDRFLSGAADRARELGATLSDVVNATASFAKLGYDVDDASELADAAIVYKNVADGIDSIDEASESIISTMQAFGIETASVMTIVDKFNEVSNNYAITSEGLGQALQRSAAAMKAGGNTLDETIALVTSANRIVQNPESVGTTMKTISMYLRAAKTEAEAAGEDIEGMASSVSELREEILQLTGNKVDIQMDDKSFKSTFQILKELSQVWDQLTDISRANILEMIGGKRNANVVSALLENFDEAEDVVKTAADSAGSALAENEKYLDSIAGRIEKLKATFEDFSTTVMDSGLVKFAVSFADALLQAVTVLSDISFDNVFSGLATIATGGGVAAFIKNLD